MIINLAKSNNIIRKCSKSISCLVRDKTFFAVIIAGFLFVLPLTVSYAVTLENPIGINTFQDLVKIISKYIFYLAIPVAVIVIIYAGILMLTAGGNPAKFKKGAQALWYAVLGLAVVFIGEGFVTLIKSILSLQNP